MNHFRQKQGGFTLIEVLIAMVVLVIGVLGVEALQTHSATGNARAQRITEATNIAAARLEVLKSLPYTAPELQDNTSNPASTQGVSGLNDPLPPGGWTSDLINYPPDQPTTPIVVGNYNVYWNIAPNSPVQGVKTVRVIVVNNLPNVTVPPVSMTAVFPSY